MPYPLCPSCSKLFDGQYLSVVEWTCDQSLDLRQSIHLVFVKFVNINTIKVIIKGITNVFEIIENVIIESIVMGCWMGVKLVLRTAYSNQIDNSM